MEINQELADLLIAVSAEVESWPAWKRSLDPIGSEGQKKYHAATNCMTDSGAKKTAETKDEREHLWSQLKIIKPPSSRYGDEVYLEMYDTFAQAQDKMRGSAYSPDKLRITLTFEQILKIIADVGANKIAQVEPWTRDLVREVVDRLCYRRICLASPTLIHVRRKIVDDICALEPPLETVIAEHAPGVAPPAHLHGELGQPETTRAESPVKSNVDASPQLESSGEQVPLQIIKKLLEALNKAGAFLQSLDLESDYYIDFSRHRFMKSSAIEALSAIDAAIAKLGDKEYTEYDSAGYPPKVKERADPKEGDKQMADDCIREVAEQLWKSTTPREFRPIVRKLTGTECGLIDQYVYAAVERAIRMTIEGQHDAVCESSACWGSNPTYRRNHIQVLRDKVCARLRSQLEAEKKDAGNV